MSSSEHEMSRIVDLIAQAKTKVYELKYRKTPNHRLGDPCTPEQIQQFERKLKIRLPPSYKQFLMLHNGWENFSGEAHILSIESRDLPVIRDHLNDFRDLQIELGHHEVADGFVVVGGDGSTYIVYLDMRTQRPDGEADVVEYGYQEGEIARYTDFLEYLRGHYRVLTRIIEKERGKPG